MGFCYWGELAVNLYEYVELCDLGVNGTCTQL